MAQQRFRLKYNGPEYQHLKALEEAMRERGRAPQPSDFPLRYDRLEMEMQNEIDSAILRAYLNAADMLDEYLREATIDQDLMTELLGGSNT